MLEKIIETGMLFDFYGNLLSKSQREVVEMYYIDDLSLSEIGEELQISRQAVYDILKRSERKLSEFEEKLGLAKKFRIMNSDIVQIGKLIADLKSDETLAFSSDPKWNRFMTELERLILKMLKEEVD